MTPSSLPQYGAIPSHDSDVKSADVITVNNMPDKFNPPLDAPERQSSLIVAVRNPPVHVPL